MGILQERIKSLREAKNLTLLNVAEYLGVKEATTQRYESGEIKNIKHETIVKLAELFNVSPAYLMGWEDSLMETLSIPEFENCVPILGRIVAGVPIIAIDEIEYYHHVTDENIDYGLRVKGDSMSTTIRADSIIFVDQDADIQNGDIIVAIIDGEDATVKRYYRQGDTVILRPDNPNYTEREYLVQEVEICGKVVGEYKKF
jgi:repressor LexA